MQAQANLVAQSAKSRFSPAASSPSAKEEREVVQLHRVNLKEFIESQHGKFVSIDFSKLDGEARTLTGRLGVKAYLRGGKNTVVAAERPYITVFDVQLRQYRTVNLETACAIRACGKIHQIVG